MEKRRENSGYIRPWPEVLVPHRLECGKTCMGYPWQKSHALSNKKNND